MRTTLLITLLALAVSGCREASLPPVQAKDRSQPAAANTPVKTSGPRIPAAASRNYLRSRPFYENWSCGGLPD